MRKTTTKRLKTIAQFPYFSYVEKSSKNYNKRNVYFFIDNKLISSNQSGFKPSDSCINQLLSITHEIYESLDDEMEVRSMF